MADIEAKGTLKDVQPADSGFIFVINDGAADWAYMLEYSSNRLLEKEATILSAKTAGNQTMSVFYPEGDEATRGRAGEKPRRASNVVWR